MDIEKEPMTLGDLAVVQALITVEIVRACSASSHQADNRLRDIAQRIFELGNAAVDVRDRSLFVAVANAIASTESPTSIQ